MAMTSAMIRTVVFIVPQCRITGWGASQKMQPHCIATLVHNALLATGALACLSLLHPFGTAMHPHRADAKGGAMTVIKVHSATIISFQEFRSMMGVIRVTPAR